MVSRRNFFSITIMMLTLLLMFQLTQVYYENIAETDKNIYSSNQVTSGANEWKPEAIDTNDPILETQYVLFFGDKDGAIGHTVQQWCNYTKRNLTVCSDPSSFSGKIGTNQEYVLVESAQMDVQNDLDKLEAFAKAGVRIVFCDLPDVEVIKQSDRLQKLLGIRAVMDDQVTVAGIQLFSGFFLGGEVTHYAESTQKEDLEMPWYQLRAGAQSYMVGFLDSKNENSEASARSSLPALMWSYSDGQSKIFVVNGPYLQDNTGVGILSAVDAKLSEYVVYPILDAQLLTVANYPGLANENAEVMHRVFSSSMVQAGRDIVFPQLIATATQAEFTMSCMLQTQYDYTDTAYPEADVFRSYLKLMKTAGAEMGLSLERQEGTQLAEKLAEDSRFFENANSQYLFSAAYTADDSFDEIIGSDSLPDSVRTVVSDQRENQDLISFGNNLITVQTITGDASVHSFRSDLYMRSVQTSLGYTNVLLDLNRVFWPGEDEKSWEALSKACTDNLYTSWRNFQNFGDVTVSQNDRRIRNLLNMDYSYVRKGKAIYLDLENTEQATSFILRLQNMEPEYVDGATCILLEEGIYLIRTTGQSVVIHLKNSNPIPN